MSTHRVYTTNMKRHQTRINISLPSWLHAAATKQAAKTTQSFSGYIRTLIIADIRKGEETNG